MLLENLIILAIESFVVGFSGAIVPGPVFIATIAHSVQRGYVSGCPGYSESSGKVLLIPFFL